MRKKTGNPKETERMSDAELEKISAAKEFVILWVFNEELTLPSCGINEGDGVFIKRKSSFNETDIGLWHTPEGTFLRFAYLNFGDLSLDDKAGNIRRFRRKDCTFYGNVEFVLSTPKLCGDAE
jgi:hypothetical protein